MAFVKSLGRRYLSSSNSLLQRAPLSEISTDSVLRYRCHKPGSTDLTKVRSWRGNEVAMRCRYEEVLYCVPEWPFYIPQKIRLPL